MGCKSSVSYGVWKCLSCHVEKTATSHQKRQKYCSIKCYSEERKKLTGSLNPNYRGGNSKECSRCKKTFYSYVKQRLFCSLECYWSRNKKQKLQQKEKIKNTPHHKNCVQCGKSFRCWKTSNKVTCSPACSLAYRSDTRVTKKCLTCWVEFKSYPSSKRKYCSYKCHLDNGGAFKAGLAAAKATMKYGSKKDANHAEMFAVLRKHCAAYDVSTSGMGIPDGLAWINGAWHLFDIKNPKTGYGKRGLNPIQKKWLSQAHGGPIYLLYTVEDAERFATGKFDGLKFELPEI